ncbi:hypothetical protein DSL64_23460 [Dyadobacter luteus]|jgi:hypothetical protein|uniref:DUF6249 domain-containing protein n=1 Tax=Dyadobacter luteus TaxID=2259619 RepID=A0A3D8Y4V3_9BACT|nr:DUF6249 domain-containing protein [Dyadobacter luteus]REA57490.1 hypothetical protein DSL64_23460 [Dyadobacter luteus]
MEHIKHIIITVTAIGSVFGVLYVLMMTRYRERMAMIERNVDASLFTSKGSISPTLKFGMLLVGVALGILMGNVLHDHYSLSRGTSFSSMTLLFGGISLIINFVIERRLDRKSEE